ncbi:hypothetical protein COO60DRAFT_1683462, partial [Scenedesmus sp. NREL 46B-D3]
MGLVKTLISVANGIVAAARCWQMFQPAARYMSRQAACWLPAICNALQSGNAQALFQAVADGNAAAVARQLLRLQVEVAIAKTGGCGQVGEALSAAQSLANAAGNGAAFAQAAAQAEAALASAGNDCGSPTHRHWHAFSQAQSTGTSQAFSQALATAGATNAVRCLPAATPTPSTSPKPATQIPEPSSSPEPSQVLASSGNNCGSPVAQAMARAFSQAQASGGGAAQAFSQALAQAGAKNARACLPAAASPANPSAPATPAPTPASPAPAGPPANVTTNPTELQQQLTNPATSTATATAISQALAASGNNCGSGVGQAIAQAFPEAQAQGQGQAFSQALSQAQAGNAAQCVPSRAGKPAVVRKEVLLFAGGLSVTREGAPLELEQLLAFAPCFSKPITRGYCITTPASLSSNKKFLMCKQDRPQIVVTINGAGDGCLWPVRQPAVARSGKTSSARTTGI